MLTPLLLRFRGLVIMLTVLYELEPEKYIDWTGHVAVFPARTDCALASFKTKFSATPFVDELDESEKSVAHTASLHTAPCVDLFLKKHKRADGASVLFGVKLRTSMPLVYELEPEKSTRCVAVFLARKDCALIFQDDRTDRVVYEGGKDGGPHGFSVEEQRGPSMADMGFGKEAQATQRTRLSVPSSSDQDVMEKVINLEQRLQPVADPNFYHWVVPVLELNGKRSDPDLSHQRPRIK